MAKGDFIWFLGDDDLLVNNAIAKLSFLIKKNIFDSQIIIL